MRKSQFKKHLDQLNEDELKDELLRLFQNVKEVKAYYDMELGSEEERKKLYLKAKTNIESKYATKSYRRPRRPRIQKINAILAEMNRKSIFQHEMVDLYLFDVETAVGFARKYNFYSNVLSNHIISVFEKACHILQEDISIQGAYRERCDEILDAIMYYPTIHIDLDKYYRATFN